MPHPNLFGVDWPTSITIALALLAVLLAALGILLIVASGIAYINFRDAAKIKAEETARIVAAQVAESVANQYIATNLPAIVQEYARVMPVVEGASGAMGDKIAQQESSD